MEVPVLDRLIAFSQSRRNQSRDPGTDLRLQIWSNLKIPTQFIQQMAMFQIQGKAVFKVARSRWNDRNKRRTKNDTHNNL
jgi:hypothetical protein